jgi:hypothetical protein
MSSDGANLAIQATMDLVSNCKLANSYTPYCCMSTEQDVLHVTFRILLLGYWSAVVVEKTQIFIPNSSTLSSSTGLSQASRKR